ncbi:aminoacylase-1-like isoform X2 [Bradysia coprophila]|uniref:aminoacylase-1-like isoform X2 n=1 Tax=Bradysia coprophila TaxID=38358 RepID=UPI00187DD212|nr:aminoacylase-1-like isoform X2 [Bradysia coprophila]
MAKWADNEEIQIFREYLQIPSVHPDIDYTPCVEFLRRQAESLELPISVYYPADENNPVIVISWEGSQPELPSIMLNSHMDVVPVFEDRWTHAPFGAEIDNDGKIFGRGAQDMKCLGTQYLAAIRALKRDGTNQLKRTIHVTFVPDEEVGGELGMKSFVTTQAFKELNVGLSLDEACASDEDNFFLFNGERTVYDIELTCNGQSGHGSSWFKNTPGEKLRHILDKFMDYRTKEIVKISENVPIGETTSINLTMINGGVQINVVPAEIKLSFDIRLAVGQDQDAFEAMIRQWCEEAGGDIDLKYISKDPTAPVSIADDRNPFWVAFKSATDELKLTLRVMACPGCTDARFIRQLNIPAFGFSPMRNTRRTLHDHDEFVYADGYLEGINIYRKIISNVANV